MKIQFNPFTPKSGQEPKIFINRDREIELFKKKLLELENHFFNHYIINGDWGSGKTSLLKHLKQVAQTLGFSCAYFSLQEFSEHVDDKEITIHILQSIYRSLPIDIKQNKGFLKSLEGFGIQILGSGFNLNFNIDKNALVDAQSLLADGLLGIFKDVKPQKGIVVLIDDIQNIVKVNRYLTTLKNVLSMEQINDQAQFLFILSSTIEGWQIFMQKNHPIGRFFIPRLHLAGLDKEQTYLLIQKTLENTGVCFDEKLYEFVWNNTKGHLFEIQILCNSLYDLQIKGKVKYDYKDRALQNSLDYLGNAIFEQQLFGLSEVEAELLYTLSTYDIPLSNKEIFQLVPKSINENSINKYLRRLTEKAILRNPHRGAYFIDDPLLRLFINKTYS